MHSLDDIDARLQRAARPDDEAVDRLTRAALATALPPRRSGRAARLAAVLVCLLTLAIWWSRRPTTLPATLESSGDAIRLQTADGTTWIFAGPVVQEYLPPGTCVVVGAGGTR
jgi:ferric-dicitrate binding protein FerR (iron transport regulator)